MGLDVNLRLRNKATGEIRDLSDNGYRGSDFKFVKQYMTSIDKYGEYVEVTDEVYEILVKGGKETLKVVGYEYDCFGEDWGLMGFIKTLHLREFYRSFGYVLEVEADWQ